MPLNREALGADTLTAERTLELLDKAVEERGQDWEYPGQGSECVYFVDEDVQQDFPGSEVGAPACIVGFVLNELGITLDDVAEANQGAGVKTLIDSFLPEILTVEPEAVELLIEAQTAQDTGTAWGTAVEQAHRLFEDDE